MDPRFQMMRGQTAPHPLLEFPSEEELRGGPSSDGMMSEVAHNMVDPSLYMEASQLHDPAYHPQAMFNPESPFHQLLPNSPAPGNLLPAEYFDSLLNAYGVGMDPRQMAEARSQTQGRPNPASFLHDGGLDVLVAETPGREATFSGGQAMGFGQLGSNSPVDMYGALQRFAASFANVQGGPNAPVATPRQLATDEPSPYPPPSGVDMAYGGVGQFPNGGLQARDGPPPEQGFNSRVLTSAACITAMIQKLRSPEDGVRREAMQAIRMWAGSSLLHQRAVAAAGAIPPLVDVLRTPSSTVVWVEAAQTLASLAINNEENKASIGLAGAIPPLVNLLGLPSREAREAAVGGLSCLARNEHNKQAIMDAGAVTGLVRMLTDGDNNSEFGREAAANVLAKLAVENDANKKAIGQYGAIPFLIRMVERGSAKEQEVAAGALANLIQDPQNALELVGAGGVEALSELLDCPWEGARAAASAALTQVSVHEAKWNEEFNLLQAQGLEDDMQPGDDDDELTMADEMRAAEEILRNAINENGGEEDEEDEEEGPPQYEPPPVAEVAGREQGQDDEDQPDDVSISEAESSDEDVPLVKRRTAPPAAASARPADITEAPADVTEGLADVIEEDDDEPPEDLPLALRFRIPLEEGQKRRGRRRGAKKGARKKRAAKVPAPEQDGTPAETEAEAGVAEGEHEAAVADTSAAEGSEQSSEEDVPLSLRKRVMSEEDLPILAKGLRPPVLDETVSLGVGVPRPPKRRKLEPRPRAGSGDVSSGREGSETERPRPRKRARPAAAAESWGSEERATPEPLDEEPTIRAALHSPVQATMTELLGMEDPPEGAFEDALAGEGHVTEKGSLDEALLRDEDGSEPAGWDVVRSPDEETESPEKRPGEKKKRKGAKKRAKPMQPPLKVSADVLRKPDAGKPALQLAVPEFSAEKVDAEAAQCECIGATAGVHNGDCQYRSPVGKRGAMQILASGSEKTKPDAAKPKAPLAAGLSRLIVAFAAGLNATPPPAPPAQTLRETGRKPRGRTARTRPLAAVPTPPAAAPGLQQGLPALMGMLRSASLESQEFGCLTVALLAVQGGDAAKKNMVEGAIVPALISIVRSAEAGRVSQLLRGGGFFPLAGRGGQVPGQSALGGGVTVNGRPRKRRNAFTNVGADGYSRPPPEGNSPAPARLLGPDLLPPSTNYQNGGGFASNPGGFSGPDLLPPGTHTMQQSLGPPSAAAAAARHMGLDLLPPGTSVTQFGPSGVRYRLPVNTIINRNAGAKKSEPYHGGPSAPGRMGKLLKPKSEPLVREAGVGTGGVVTSLGDAGEKSWVGQTVRKQPVQNPSWTPSQEQAVGGAAPGGADLSTAAGVENGIEPVQRERSYSPERSETVRTVSGNGAAFLEGSVDVASLKPAEYVDLTEETAGAGESTEKRTAESEPLAANEQPTESTEAKSTVAQETGSAPKLSSVGFKAESEPRSLEAATLPSLNADGSTETERNTDGNETGEGANLNGTAPLQTVTLKAAQNVSNGTETESPERLTGNTTAEGSVAQAADGNGTASEEKSEGLRAETVIGSTVEHGVPLQPDTATADVAAPSAGDVIVPRSDVCSGILPQLSDQSPMALDPAPTTRDQSSAAVDHPAAPNPTDNPSSNPSSNAAVSTALGGAPAPDGSLALIPRALSTNAASQVLVSASETPSNDPDKSNPKHLAALARIAAANALSTLCVGNLAGKDAAVRAGGVQALAIMAALAQGDAAADSPRPPSETPPEERSEASERCPDSSEGRADVTERAQGARNAERAAALSALASLALSDGPQKQRMSAAATVPWLARMMEGADALEVAAGAGGLQSIAASLDSEKTDEPHAASASVVASAKSTDLSAAKHMPLELAFTLMELIAGGGPEAKSAAIQALASFLIVRQDLASKLGGFGGLGGAYFGLHEQLRQAGRAGARALLSLLAARADPAVRESAVGAVAGAAAGSRRLLGWLEEEGVAPALTGIFRTGESEGVRALALAAAFDVGALKGKLTGMGGEDVRSLVEFLRAEAERKENEEKVRKEKEEKDQKEKEEEERKEKIGQERKEEAGSGEVVAKAEVADGGTGLESQTDGQTPEAMQTEGADVKTEEVAAGTELGAEELPGSDAEKRESKLERISAEVPTDKEIVMVGGAGVEEGKAESDFGNAVVTVNGASINVQGASAPKAGEGLRLTKEGDDEAEGPAMAENPHESEKVEEEEKGDDAPAVEPVRVASSPIKECKLEPEDGAGDTLEDAPSSIPEKGPLEPQSADGLGSGHVAADNAPPDVALPQTASESPVALEGTAATGSTASPLEQSTVLLNIKAAADAAKDDVTALVARPEGHLAAAGEAHVAPNPPATSPAVAELPTPASPVDHAAGVLVYAALGCDSIGHAALVSAGGIPCIIDVLAGKGRGLGGPAREAAAAALMMLAASSEQTSRDIRAAGGVAPLVEILAAAAAAASPGNLAGGKLWGEKEAAAAALVVLAGRCEDGRNALIRAGGVRALVAALKCSEPCPPAPPTPSEAPGGLSPTGTAAIAQLLSTLAVHHPEARSEMTSLGVIRPLVDVLMGGRRSPGGKEEEGTIAQEAAAAALANIVQGDPASAREVVGAGAIVPLVRALEGDAAARARGAAPSAGGQLAAMTALASLVRTLPECQKEMVGAGAVGRLMALVAPPGQMRQMKETAALVLTELATEDRELQDTVGASGAIAVLVGMLNGPGKGKLAAARALSILTSQSEPNKHRARKAGADVSVLSTLRFPGQPDPPGSGPERIAKAGSHLPVNRPTYQGARQPLTQVPGGASRVVNAPGKAMPGGRVLSAGVGQNQAPRGPQNVRQMAVGGPYFSPGSYAALNGGRGPIVHHIRVPQPRTPQYYRPAYPAGQSNPPGKATPQRAPSVFPPAVIRGALQRPGAIPGQSYVAPQQPGLVRGFVPRTANGPGRPPVMEMGTQAQSIPLADGRTPAGIPNQTKLAPMEAKPARAEVGLQVSAKTAETGSQSCSVEIRKAAEGPPVQEAATEGRPIDAAPKATAEMGCQARPLPPQPYSIASEPSRVLKVQTDPVTERRQQPPMAAGKPPEVAPDVTQPPNPVVNEAPATNPVAEPVSPEINSAPPVAAEDNRPGLSKAFPNEAACAPATSADVDGAPKMTSAARAGSDLSLQMLAEVTAAAEAERELERNESKRGPSISGGTKRARGEGAARPPLAEGASSDGGLQHNSTNSDELPRPPKKPRTGMHRTPAKMVAERFPGFPEESREQQGQTGGRSPGSDETGRKEKPGRTTPADGTASERGRRMKLRGSSQRET